MGDLSSTAVRIGNLLSSRFALLCIVALVYGCFWMVPHLQVVCSDFDPVYMRVYIHIYIYMHVYINIYPKLFTVSKIKIKFQDPQYIDITIYIYDIIYIYIYIILMQIGWGQAQVEQPGSSRLRDSPYYVHLLQNCGPAFFQRTWLGLFGHWCCKATQLFGSTWGAKVLQLTYIFIYVYCLAG